MPTYSRVVMPLLALALLMACAPSAPQGTSVTTPNAVPTSAEAASTTAEKVPPTMVVQIPANVLVSGINVGELTPAQAHQKLSDALSPLLRPLELHVGNAGANLQPERIDFQLKLDDMLAAALAAQTGERIPLRVDYDPTKLQTALEQLALLVAKPPTLTVLSDTETISHSFAISTGAQLDITTAMQTIDERLHNLGAPRRVTLPLATDTHDLRPTPDQLQAQIEAMAKAWRGIVGLYVYDLNNDRVIAQLNQNTVFSGASVMKVPILLRSYITLPTFSTKQETWLRKMIVESDNFSANNMLAASAGGTNTDDALNGALEMSAMLKQLGLEHTYQNMPYEASDYLINIRKIKIRRGPPHEGSAPFTEPDPVLRTTPAEMSRVFLWIYQCSKGQGLLLDTFGKTLTAARCQEMLDRLEDNGDHTRFVAGLPTGTRIAHKSGWIEDMQADVGIIRSPGGDFLMATYIYRQIVPGKNYLSDAVAAPVLASFARLVYSYYNPTQLP